MERNRSTSWKFGTVNTLMQGTQIDNSPIENLSIARKFSMATLIEEMKPVVLLKYDFEYREKLNLFCFVWKCRTIRILKQERKTMIFLVEYSSTSAVFWIEIMMEEIELVVSQLGVWMSSEIKINSPLEDLDCLESDARIKTKGLSIESSPTNGKCSMEILIGGSKPVLEKYEFDYRNKSKILNFF